MADALLRCACDRRGRDLRRHFEGAPRSTPRWSRLRRRGRPPSPSSRLSLSVDHSRDLYLRLEALISSRRHARRSLSPSSCLTHRVASRRAGHEGILEERGEDAAVVNLTAQLGLQVVLGLPQLRPAPVLLAAGQVPVHGERARRGPRGAACTTSAGPCRPSSDPAPAWISFASTSVSPGSCIGARPGGGPAVGIPYTVSAPFTPARRSGSRKCWSRLNTAVARRWQTSCTSAGQLPRDPRLRPKEALC